jgi:hypothetical protein
MGAMTSLNLASNRLEAEGAKIVADAIKVTIVHLRSFWYYFHVHLTSQSTTVVCYYPQDMRAMTSLNLSGNFFGPDGAKHVVEVIKVSNCVVAIILASFSFPSDH